MMRADFRQKVPKIRMVRISPELWSKYDLLMMRVVPKIHMGRIPPKQSQNLMFNDLRAIFGKKLQKPKFDHSQTKVKASCLTARIPSNITYVRKFQHLTIAFPIPKLTLP